jgi:hypothetical protein
MSGPLGYAPSGEQVSSLMALLKKVESGDITIPRGRQFNHGRARREKTVLGGRKKRFLDASELRECKKLRGEGWKYPAIAEKLGISKQAAWSAVNKKAA